MNRRYVMKEDKFVEIVNYKGFKSKEEAMEWFKEQEELFVKLRSALDEITLDLREVSKLLDRRSTKFFEKLKALTK